MGETSSTRDAFARRGAPGADRMGSGADHFKRGADKTAGDHFRSAGGPTFDPAHPKQDAFAKKSAAAKPAPQKAVQAAKPSAAKPSAAKPAPAKRDAPVRAAALAPVAAEGAARRGGLHVVSSEARTEAKPQPPIDDLMLGPAHRTETRRPDGGKPKSGRIESERVDADARPRPAGKTSSLVLVTGGGLAAASSVDTLDKPAPVETPPPPP
jgi:hypothetical protein